MTKTESELLRGMLLTKKVKLQAAQQQFVNSVNACGGAIQVCDELLAELDEEDAGEAPTGADQE